MRDLLRSRHLPILTTILLSVSVVVAVGATATDVVTEEVGAEATYSGCLVGGRILKILSKDRNPDRCEGLATPAGTPARYVTWNAAGVEGPQGKRGRRGLPGSTGAQGPTGAPGIQGPNGPVSSTQQNQIGIISFGTADGSLSATGWKNGTPSWLFPGMAGGLGGPGSQPYAVSVGHPVPAISVPFQAKCQEISFGFNGLPAPTFSTKLKIYAYCNIDPTTGLPFAPSSQEIVITIPANTSCGCIRSIDTAWVGTSLGLTPTGANPTSSVSVAIQSDTPGSYLGCISVSLKLS